MPHPDVPAPVRELARCLAQPAPMRRGSLSVRYLKCNKPGCACARAHPTQPRGASRSARL